MTKSEAKVELASVVERHKAILEVLRDFMDAQQAGDKWTGALADIIAAIEAVEDAT